MISLLIQIESENLNEAGIINALESKASRDDLSHTNITVLLSDDQIKNHDTISYHTRKTHGI